MTDKKCCKIGFSFITVTKIPFGYEFYYFLKNLTLMAESYVNQDNSIAKLTGQILIDIIKDLIKCNKEKMLRGEK